MRNSIDLAGVELTFLHFSSLILSANVITKLGRSQQRNTRYSLRRAPLSKSFVQLIYNLLQYYKHAIISRGGLTLLPLIDKEVLTDDLVDIFSIPVVIQTTSDILISVLPFNRPKSRKKTIKDSESLSIDDDDTEE